MIPFVIVSQNATNIEARFPSQSIPDSNVPQNLEATAAFQQFQWPKYALHMTMSLLERLHAIESFQTCTAAAFGYLLAVNKSFYSCIWFV